MSEHRDLSPDIDDEEVRRAYDTLPPEEVPASLDARVLQAASAALKVRRKPAWLRWCAPIALAASVLVVVAIVLDPGARKQTEVVQSLHVPQSAAPTTPAAEPVPPPAMEIAPAAAPKANGAMQPSASDTRTKVSAKLEERVEVTAQSREQVMQDAPLAVSTSNEQGIEEREAAAQSADAARRSLEEQRVISNAKFRRQMDTLAREPPSATTITSAAPPAPAPPIASSESKELQMTGAGQPDAKLDAWLRQIVKLQTAGDDQSAEREIAKLRKAYPGLDIPAALERLRRQEGGKP